MSSDSLKPLVLIIGATGLTGESIVQGLLDSGNFVGVPTYVLLNSSTADLP